MEVVQGIYGPHIVTDIWKPKGAQVILRVDIQGRIEVPALALPPEQVRELARALIMAADLLEQRGGR